MSVDCRSIRNASISKTGSDLGLIAGSRTNTAVMLLCLALSLHGRWSPTPSQQAKDERDEKEHDEYPKDELRNLDRDCSDSAEAQDSSRHRNKKKEDGPTKHVITLKRFPGSGLRTRQTR
jgi:hypothetical protein